MVIRIDPERDKIMISTGSERSYHYTYFRDFEDDELFLFLLTIRFKGRLGISSFYATEIKDDTLESRIMSISLEKGIWKKLRYIMTVSEHSLRHWVWLQQKENWDDTINSVYIRQLNKEFGNEG